MDPIAEAVDRLLFDPSPLPERHLEALLVARVVVNPMWLESATIEAGRSARLRDDYEAGRL